MSHTQPFTRRQPVHRTLLQFILRQKPPENALVELVNRLADGRLREITTDDVNRIGKTYGITIAQRFRVELENLYRNYMRYCLMDRKLTDEELADLAHLARLFELDAVTCAAIQRHLTRQLYFRTVSEVLADGTIDESERQFLQRLQEQLNLPAGDAENIVELRERQMRRPQRTKKR